MRPLFAADGSIVVIDWQAISRGGGTADVGYFVSQNLSTDDRRANEADLLRAYHDELRAGGVADYGYEQLLDDYTVGISCGWMIPVLAVGSLDFTSERAVTLWTAVVERTQAALLDHGFGF